MSEDDIVFEKCPILKGEGIKQKQSSHQLISYFTFICSSIPEEGET